MKARVKRIHLLENYVKQQIDRATTPALNIAHDYKHVDRVRCWALHIARNEGFANLALVEATALLHDIGLTCVEERQHHAQTGAEMAAKFLAEQRLFSEDEIEAIAEAIRCHSALSGGGQLGEILRDADILDLLGAAGIMRAFTSQHASPEYDPANIKGETWGMTASDFTDRFHQGLGIGKHAVDYINFQISCFDNLQTETAKQIAHPLAEFMKLFLLQLEAEINTE